MSEEEEGNIVEEEEEKPKRGKKGSRSKKGAAARRSGGKDAALEAARADTPLNLTEAQEKEYNKLKGDEKKKFEIRQKTVENRYLDKKDQHEISLEDERFAGLVPA
jgi:hypothetical protein